METDEFEWNDNKAALVRREHGVDFWEAVHVFDDVFHVIVPDQTRHADRWKAIGLTGKRMLTVVHTDGRDGRIRIITAWPSTKGEIDDYYAR